MLRFTTKCILALLLAIVSSVALAAPVADITPAQKDQLKALAADTKGKISHERDSLRHSRTDLFQAYRSYNLDEPKAKVALSRISVSQLRLLNIHLERQISVRRILSESQFIQFVERMQARKGHGENEAKRSSEDAVLERLLDKGMIATLSISPDQEKRLRHLLASARRKAVTNKLRGDSKQMLDLYTQYPLDAGAARKLIASIHQSQDDLAALNHQRQQFVRQVLTADQFAQLQAEIAKLVKAHEHDRGEERRPDR